MKKVVFILLLCLSVIPSFSQNEGNISPTQKTILGITLGKTTISEAKLIFESRGLRMSMNGDEGCVYCVQFAGYEWNAYLHFRRDYVEEIVFERRHKREYELVEDFQDFRNDLIGKYPNMRQTADYVERTPCSYDANVCYEKDIFELQDANLSIRLEANRSYVSLPLLLKYKFIGVPANNRAWDDL